MGITVLIACFATIAVVIFQVIFNEIETSPYKKIYYDIIIKLSENPNDTKLKNKAIEAGNDYYSRIKAYGMGGFRGAVTSVRQIRFIGPIDEKILYEDMLRITKTEKKPKE